MFAWLITIGNDNGTRDSQNGLNPVTEQISVRLDPASQIGDRRVKNPNVDPRTLRGLDHGLPLGLWRRVEDIQQASDPAGELLENPRIALLNGPVPRKTEIVQSGGDHLLKAETEPHREHDRQGDRRRGAPAPPSSHQAAPFNVTGRQRHIRRCARS